MDPPPRRVLVTGAHPLATGLARGLTGRGATVVVTAPEPGPTGSDAFVPCAFSSEQDVAIAFDRAAAELGGIDQVVHAWIDPGLLDGQELVDVAPSRWVATCEGSLAGGWWVARQTRAVLRGPGSLVFVVPSSGLTGAAGHAMLATVSEGLRVLAKGCARQWAPRGVTVNTVVTAPHHWVDPATADALSRAITLAGPALGTRGDPADDLAPLVAALADEATHFVTGATLVADGAEWTGL